MKVAVVLGSASDENYARRIKSVLDALDVEADFRVLSAHRTPEETVEFARRAADSGYGVIIAVAGYSAALPGLLAAHTLLPVLAVPAAAGPLRGVDALLASVQMPKGVPVAALTVGEAGADNAALMAARVLALRDADLRGRLAERVEAMRRDVLDSDGELGERLRE